MQLSSSCTQIRQIADKPRQNQGQVVAKEKSLERANEADGKSADTTNTLSDSKTTNAHIAKTQRFHVHPRLIC